jgi:hypothetical protein
MPPAPCDLRTWVPLDIPSGHHFLPDSAQDAGAVEDVLMDFLHGIEDTEPVAGIRPQSGDDRRVDLRAVGDGEPMRGSSASSDRLLMDGSFGVVSSADTPLTDLKTAMLPKGNSLPRHDSRVSSRDLGTKIGRSG